MKRIAGMCWSAWVSLGMCVNAGVMAQTTVGRTAGEASVSATGAAQYRIPLDLPPGTNGLAPELAIVYDHHGGNGLLGVGFRLAGFSAIRRCGGTIAQDGSWFAVGLDGTDRLCLDGQRLRLTSGAYGQAGSQYQTEVETFSRVTASGTAGAGPASFQVERRDGLIYQYGATADSRIESLGSATPRAWALNRIRDRSGNYIDFVYLEDTATGSYRPARVDYTGHVGTGSAPYYSVRFTYESRVAGDQPGGYLAGGLVQESYRLARIDAQHVSGTVLRSYLLAYESSTATARSRLASLQECVGAACFQPTRFTWAGTATGWSAEAPTGIDAASLGTSIVGDGNGDGFEDLGYCDVSARRWKVLHGAATGLAGPAVDAALACEGSAPAALSADLDGNGRRDIVVAGTGGVWQWLHHDGGTTYAAASTGVADVAMTGGTALLDIDGDGLDDFVYVKSAGSAIHWRRNLSASGVLAFAEEATLWTAPAGTRIAAAPFGTNSQRSRSTSRAPDFNGDGRGDALMHVQADGCAGATGCTPSWKDRWQAFVSRGQSFVAQATLEWSTDPLLADFNGDGLTDVVHSPSGSSWQLVLATGRRGSTEAGALSVTAAGAPTTSASGKAMVTDWDGDGRSDLLVPGSGEWLACRSLGASLDTCRATGMSSIGVSGSPVVLDANGDGLPDLAMATSGVKYRAHAAGRPDLLAAAVDGFGNRADFQYAPLTQPGVHVPGVPAVYPVLDSAAPLWVVSRLSRSDGIGGTYQLGYAYEGGKLHALGRGFLGFARRTASDSRTGLVTVEDYLQDPAAFEWLGRVSAVTTRQSNGVTVAAAATQWAQLEFGTGGELRRFPYVAVATTDRYELDGARISRTEAQNQVDAFGTVVARTTTTTEIGTGLNPGASHVERVVVGPVTNDTTSWCLGLPGTTQVTRSHTLQGGEPVTRTSAQTIDAAACRPTQQVVEPGNADLRVTTDIAYDAYGNVNSRTTSAAGVATRTSAYGWSNAGRFLQSVTNAEGHRSTSAWDAVRAVRTSANDPNGLRTQWMYDAFRRPVHVYRPDGTGAETTFGSCAGSCAVATADHYARVVEHGSGGLYLRATVTGYDALDREVYRQTEQPGGSVLTINRYSAQGLLAQQSSPAWCCASPQFWTTYSFDVLGRRTRTERPTSATDSTPVVTRWNYGGLTTTETDPLGRTNVQRRDAIGNVLQTVDAGNAATSYAYDAFGNMVEIRDAQGSVTSMVYDLRGRRTRLQDPDSGARTYLYSPLGELKSQTNARGQTVTLAYDRLSRPISRQEPEGTTVWSWGTSAAARNVGALASLTGSDFQETRSYDSYGRLAVKTSTLTGTPYTMRLSYSGSTGQLDVLTYPAISGTAPLRVRHLYDRGRLVALTDADDPNTVFWVIGLLDAAGRVADETLGNGVRIASGFDAVTGLLGSRTSGPGGGSAYQNLSYDWDVVGNLSSRREGNLGVRDDFSYDDRDRLDFVQNSSGSSVDLGYDEVGNLTFKSDVGEYTYDATKRHAVVSAGSNSYAYDENGAVVNANGATILWTSFDLPSRIQHPGGNYSLFEYAPDRSRKRQLARSGDELTDVVYAADGLYERVTRNGVTSQRNYLVADGRRVGVHTRKAGSAPTTVYLLADHLGGVDGLTSASGSLLARASNKPFGARRAGDWVGSSPTAAEWQQLLATTPRGFTDHEHVDNLGLIHMNGRVYDPVLGRFLSPDPLVQSPYDSQSLNRYSYVRNNPLRYLDPSGFCGGPPAMGYGMAKCFYAPMEQVVVQASRLYDMPADAFWGRGGRGGGFGYFANEGSGGDGAGDDMETVVVSAPRDGSADVTAPADLRILAGYNLLLAGVFDQIYAASTELGAEAASYYADKQTETGNGLYAVPGALAALWTPETAPLTGTLFGLGSGLARWSGRPFWQYYPAGSDAYRSTWLTRGPGWSPPYQTGPEAASRLALPGYNPGTAVRPVNPPWYEYVRGPREVEPQPSFGRGAVGGGREYRVISFED